MEHEHEMNASKVVGIGIAVAGGGGGGASGAVFVGNRVGDRRSVSARGARDGQTERGSELGG